MKIGNYIEDAKIIESIIEQDFKDLNDEELTEEMEMMQFKIAKLQSEMEDVESSIKFLNGMIRFTALTKHLESKE